MGLAVKSKAEDPDEWTGVPILFGRGHRGRQPTLTGHDAGLITVNIAEADDSERERRRVQLHEPYRTLLGHFRHEIGHYYWDRLIRDSAQLEAFRALFGDERARLCAGAEAVIMPTAAHRRTGSSTSSAPMRPAHPWEDWAETWAHYLHITDTLETAAACGLSLRPRNHNEPALDHIALQTADRSVAFDQLIADWFPVTYVLNNLNRGMGLPDAYPFVLSPAAIEKFRFVHDVIAAAPSASIEPQAPLARGSEAAAPA